MTMPGPPASGPRPDYADLPQEVRAWVESGLAAPVVEVVTQRSGFSPGVAARLRDADGRRWFLKAASAAVNAEATKLHRREADILARLPPGLAAPVLRGVYDDGHWVGLLLDDINGRHPYLPWQLDELMQVLGFLDRLSSRLTPAPLILPGAAERFAEAFCGWRTLAASMHPVPDPWASRHRDAMAAIEASWPDASAGSTVAHGDVRADNLLLGADQVWLVDWPHAAVGAAWLDLVLFAPSVAMQGGPAPEALLARSVIGRHADSDAVTVIAVALAGYLLQRSLLPPPPGLPTVRAFQAGQARPALAWARRLTRLR